MNHGEVVYGNRGMLQELIAYMNDAENVAALTAKGLDIAPLRTRLQNKLTAMTQKMKRALRLQVRIVKKSQPYRLATSERDRLHSQWRSATNRLAQLTDGL